MRDLCRASRGLTWGGSIVTLLAFTLASTVALSSGVAQAAIPPVPATFVATSVPVEDSPTSVTTGDVNGDGALDLAAVNLDSDTVSVALGNGDGTFGPHTDHSTAPGPYSLVLGDVDSDGDLDLATANRNSATVSVPSGRTSSSPSTRPLGGCRVAMSTVTVISISRWRPSASATTADRAASRCC
jgi:hypothetical protein